MDKSRNGAQRNDGQHFGNVIFGRLLWHNSHYAKTLLRHFPNDIPFVSHKDHKEFFGHFNSFVSSVPLCEKIIRNGIWETIYYRSGLPLFVKKK